MKNLDKLSKVKDFRNIANEFIEFCESKGVYLLPDNSVTSINADDMIFEMFDIDKKELEKERQELLNSLN